MISSYPNILYTASPSIKTDDLIHLNVTDSDHEKENGVKEIENSGSLYKTWGYEIVALDKFPKLKTYIFFLGSKKFS